MGDFKKFGGYSGKRDGGKFENRSGGRPSFGGKPGFRPGGNNYTDRPMHKATCSECGKMCEVPFRPTGEKPVLCNHCFGDKKEAQSKKHTFGAHESSARQDRRIDDLKVLVDGLHAKLDRVVDMIKNTAKATITPVKEVAKVAPVVVAKISEKSVAKKEAPKDKKVSKVAKVAKKVVSKKK